MSNENIIREIDEELRSDRMRSFWKNFGPYVIGAAVLVVLAVAVNEGWNWWQNSNSSRSSDQFYAALSLADGSDVDAAKKALDEVAAQGHGGYPVLARFREAALLGSNGRVAEAVAGYDAIATAEKNTHLRELALVMAAYLLVDGGDIAQVQQRVAGLIGANSPMRNGAREALGLAQYKAGQLDAAAQSFYDVVNDLAVVREVRTRNQIYLSQVIAEGGKDPAAPPVAATPASSTPAAPAVDSAPALDVTPPAEAPAAAPAVDAPAPTTPVEAPQSMAPATPEAPAAPASAGGATEAPAAGSAGN